jgi:hypothetical protein
LGKHLAQLVTSGITDMKIIIPRAFIVWLCITHILSYVRAGKRRRLQFIDDEASCSDDGDLNLEEENDDDRAFIDDTAYDMDEHVPFNYYPLPDTRTRIDDNFGIVAPLQNNSSRSARTSMSPMGATVNCDVPEEVAAGNSPDRIDPLPNADAIRHGSKLKLSMAKPIRNSRLVEATHLWEQNFGFLGICSRIEIEFSTTSVSLVTVVETQPRMKMLQQ